jgi:hypothetical protein
MAEPKTRKTRASVRAFLNSVSDERQRRDAKVVAAMMEDITKEKPAMWGPSIIGFGSYRYARRSGEQADWPITAFSPRKGTLTLYIMPGFENYRDQLGRLGKHKTAVSCLYIKTLDDVHMPTLKKIVRESVKRMKQAQKKAGEGNPVRFD